MLHIVNKSPHQARSLESCLRLALPGHAVLLIEDGVYAATAGSQSRPGCKTLATRSSSTRSSPIWTRAAWVRAP